MTDALSYVFVFVGIVIFTIGYRKSNRNLMLVGTVFLTFASGVNDFVVGWNSVSLAQAYTVG